MVWRLWKVRELCRGGGGLLRSSPVLHMGGRGLRGAREGFWRNHAFSRRLTCSVAGLPCALRGDCAHGSRVPAAAETAFPHDSWVFANADRARMCNIHRSGTRGARQSRSAAVRHGSRVHLGGRERPLTSLGRNWADLGAEVNRSRCGTRPISVKGVRDRAGARGGCTRGARAACPSTGSSGLVVRRREETWGERNAPAAPPARSSAPTSSAPTAPVPAAAWSERCVFRVAFQASAREAVYPRSPGGSRQPVSEERVGSLRRLGEGAGTSPNGPESE